VQAVVMVTNILTGNSHFWTTINTFKSHKYLRKN
jgi:hypothetical protein